MSSPSSQGWPAGASSGLSRRSSPRRGRVAGGGRGAHRPGRTRRRRGQWHRPGTGEHRPPHAPPLRPVGQPHKARARRARSRGRGPFDRPDRRSARTDCSNRRDSHEPYLHEARTRGRLRMATATATVRAGQQRSPQADVYGDGAIGPAAVNSACRQSPLHRATDPRCHQPLDPMTVPIPRRVEVPTPTFDHGPMRPTSLRYSPRQIPMGRNIRVPRAP